MSNRAEWLDSDETTLQGCLSKKMKPLQIYKQIPSLQKFTIGQIRTKINNLKRKDRNPKKKAQQKMVDRLKKYQLVNESSEESDDNENESDEAKSSSDEESPEDSTEEPPRKKQKITIKKEEPKPYK